MTADQLVDQAARDAIADDLDRTIFVEAGAGTGKTQSLISRVVRLIATGRATAPSLAAITFTEAAAAELRDRLRGALEDIVADAATDPVERERCEEALGDLDSAAVETIHAFCRRLLVAYPLEAGLPPGFDLVIDTEAEAVFREQWDAWFEAYLDRAANDEGVARPLLRILALDAKPAALRALASDLRQHWDRLQPGEEPTPQPDVDAGAVLAAFPRVLQYDGLCTDPRDRMRRSVARLPELERRLRLAEGELEALGMLKRICATVPEGYREQGTKRNWPDLEEVRDEMVAFHEGADAVFRPAAESAIEEVTREIAWFVLGAAEERRRAGRLEFQDLLVLARNLLATRADVRAAVRQRYTHLFIDEFQDTDPLQAEIAFLIGTSAPGVLDGDWRTLALDAGRVFFVGDPKQSIYRFRRADIDIYRQVQASFEADTVRLTQNFRSVPGVLDWVNAQFERRFDGSSPRQAPHEALHAARPPIAGGPAAYRVGGAMKATIDPVRAEEARAIVAVLRDIEAGRWQVHAEQGTRVADLRDVAILSATRPGFASLIDALEEHGVPHRVESRTQVYEAQEVRDLIATLRALDDPTDQVALVAALRSPAFACGDDDLLRYYAAGGRWDIRQGPPEGLPADDPVAAGIAWLHDEHARRWWIPLTQLVDDVIADRRLFELAMVDRRPRERWQRLRYIAEQARSYAEEPEATLRGLIEWLQQQAEERQEVRERVAAEPDDHAVRVMTIHAAKGLQFPIVILVGLNRHPNAQQRSVVWPQHGGPAVRLDRVLQTSDYEDALDEDRLLDGFEQQRLLYVAMTRAEDHLVLSCYHTERGDSEAKEIAFFADAYPDLCADITPDLDATGALPFGDHAAEDVQEPLSREAWLEQRRALIASHARRLAVSATTLAREHVLDRDRDPETDAGFEKDAPADEAPPWRRGRAGTSIGRAVHSVLQTVDLETGADLDAIAAAQATAEGVPDRVRDVARLARAALESSAVREAVGAGRYWREVYVASEIDGVIVDGFIDLLYETGDGFVVVDYKTDSIGEHGLDEVLDRYRPQALAYALVLSRQLQRPVLRCDFVFVSAPAEAAVRTVEVSQQALDELRVAVAR